MNKVGRVAAGVLSLFVLAWPLAVRAEVPVLTAEQLQKDATHVVVGKVQKVYKATNRDKDWENTAYVAEIAIDKVEKGEGLKPGSLTYVRYWRTAWLGKSPPPPHASGHDTVKIGDAVRVFLAQDKKDKGLDVLLPNGFEPKTSR